MVTLDRTSITRVMSYLFGRYVSIKKTNGFLTSMATPINAQEYQKAEYFKLVYDDETRSVFRHTWSGTTNSLKTFYAGIDESTVAGMLQVIARNTFSYFGMKNGNTFYFKHKRFKSAPTQLNEILSMSKAITGDEVSYVRINDYFTSQAEGKGRVFGTNDTIEYKIPLNAYRTQNGWFYSMTYNDSGVKQVQNFYDAEIQVKDVPAKVIAEAEYQAHNAVRDQYDIELHGIDYDFDKSYSVDYGQYQGTFRPITIEKDLLNYKNKTFGG